MCSQDDIAILVSEKYYGQCLMLQIAIVGVKWECAYSYFTGMHDLYCNTMTVQTNIT